MTLEEVCQAFEDWRINRSSRREPIPTYLWDMARALLSHYKATTIRKALHLSGEQFKQHCTVVKKAEVTPKQKDGFAEILLPQVESCELTLQGKRNRLSIKISTQQLPVVLPLLEAYL